MPQSKLDRKLTVAHIMPWSAIGGVEIATLRLTDATRDCVRNLAFCLPDAFPLKQSFEQQGIETITYAAPEPSLRHGAKYYLDSRVIAHELKRLGADVVHFSDEKAAYHTSLAARLAGVRTVCHMRVSYPTLSTRSRLCLLPVQSFIFVSQEAMRTFAISLPAGKARVIYDAVEVPATDGSEDRRATRQKLGIPDHCTVVGTVARVSPQKDYFTLASAAVEVLNKHPNTRFLIVGDNSLVDLNRKHYEDVAKRLVDLGIADKFIFLGHRTDTAQLISAMDFCVLSTHREGFPLSILESMALRKAVVATAVGGIPEIIQPGINGFLHQHADSKELAQQILYLIENPNQTAAMGQAGCELVRHNYSRDKYTHDILKAYSAVMQA